MPANHIQGPWRVVTHSWSHVSIYAGERGSECVCRLSVDEDEATEETQGALEAQMRARATAIAALPDLLDALRVMVGKAGKQNWNDQYPEELAQAFDALFKATGR